VNKKIILQTFNIIFMYIVIFDEIMTR